MPSYSDIEKEIDFQAAYTEFMEYNNYTVYVKGVWVGDHMLPISNFSSDELVIRNQNEKEIEFDELPKDIRNDIMKEII